MDRLTLTAGAFCLLISVAQPQDFTILTENRQINVAEGGNAFLSVKPSAAAGTGGWDYKNTTTTTNIDIVVWVGSAIGFRNNYGERAELFLPNGSLLLKSVRVSDSGDYTVKMGPTGGGADASATLTLHVLEPVSNVTVSSNNSKPIENIDTILLTCNASGSIQSRIWYQDAQVIKEDDRVITSPDNATLTIISVNRNNSGTYRCNASNDFSSNFGDTNLQINYGPEKVIITPRGPIQVELGKTLTLNCAAQSVPPATYEWYNGSSLLQTGQTYNIESISLNADGSYTCRAYNNITTKSKNTTIQVTVKAVSPPVKKLSVGGIIGIVIAVLVVVALIIGITAWMFKQKICRAKCGSQHNNIKMASQGNEPVSYSNGTNTQTTKPKEIDVVYAQPYILQQGPNASTASTEINKTDYAELKFK